MLNFQNKKYGILKGIVVLLFFFSTNTLNAQSDGVFPPKTIKMVDEMVIGDDPSKPIEYSFGRLRDIAVDKNGNIFVADLGAMTIKVFDHEGNYLRSIGGRGRGPGEFLSVKELGITGEGELIVADRMGLRVTKLDIKGKALGTYALKKGNWDVVFFNQIEQLPDKTYLILYQRFGARFDENKEKPFHLWDTQFDKLLKEFGSSIVPEYESDFAQAVVTNGTGSFFLKDQNNLLFAPSIYNGKIYHYKKQNDTWPDVAEEVTGFDLPFPSTESYGGNEKIDKREEGVIEAYTQDGIFRGKVLITSAGIFSLNNGYTTHFILKIKKEGQNKGKWELGVEMFDDALNFRGYFPLRHFNKLNNIMEPSIRAKDGEDNFYMLSNEGYPVVRKFSLDIQEK